MKTRFIESILLGRAMNPIWTVENSDDGTWEVLDGMHRLTTALKFLSNDFALGVSLATLDSVLYKGKKFDDLSEEDVKTIVEAIENPAKPNEKLKEAAETYMDQQFRKMNEAKIIELEYRIEETQKEIYNYFMKTFLN
jgi:TRAP-type C4-dicarboxylate transport system substrate-binding protein